MWQDTVTAHQRDRIGIPTSVVRHEGGRTLDLCEAIILYYTRGVKGREVFDKDPRSREEAVSSACVRGLCGGVDGPSRRLWTVVEETTFFWWSVNVKAPYEPICAVWLVGGKGRGSWKLGMFWGRRV